MMDLNQCEKKEFTYVLNCIIHHIQTSLYSYKHHKDILSPFGIINKKTCIWEE